MAKSEQKRQAQLAKKKAKVKQRHQEIARKQQALASLAGKMAACSRGEILFAGISEDVPKVGLGYAVIARRGPDNLCGLVILLLDTGCLGVKDVVASLVGPDVLRDNIERLKGRDVLPASPELVRGLVERTVEYAKSCGFNPHPDYAKVTAIWGDIASESVEGKFTFGRDGKPFFMAGPYDDATRQRHIMQTLERTCGAGNYNFAVGAPSTNLSTNGAGGYLEEDDDFDIDDED